jgi:hypothetical protein
MKENLPAANLVASDFVLVPMIDWPIITNWNRSADLTCEKSTLPRNQSRMEAC